MALSISCGESRRSNADPPWSRNYVAFVLHRNVSRRGSRAAVGVAPSASDQKKSSPLSGSKPTVAGSLAQPRHPCTSQPSLKGYSTRDATRLLESLIHDCRSSWSLPDWRATINWTVVGSKEGASPNTVCETGSTCYAWPKETAVWAPTDVLEARRVLPVGPQPLSMSPKAHDFQCPLDLPKSALFPPLRQQRPSSDPVATLLRPCAA